MRRRIVSLYFPHFAIDRLHLEDSWRRSRPVAVAEEERGHMKIAAVNAIATQAGVRVGARISDALLLAPLEVVPADRALDRAVLTDWVRWCDRYTPLVADDRNGGILLDITGCAHLFGGERALLLDLESRIRKLGYRARGAIACTYGAAWALARYSKTRIVPSAVATRDALLPLPVEALRLPSDAVRQLRRIGIFTVASLRELSRDSLATRYGPEVLLRLDQTFGNAHESFHSHRDSPPYCAGQCFDFPVVDLSMLEYALQKLLRRLCMHLGRDNAGARDLYLQCHRVDGEVLRCRIGTIKPVREVRHLMRLFSEKLNGLDFGCGVERMLLSVETWKDKNSEQLHLRGDTAEQELESEFDGLLDRLGLRLGFEAIARVRIQQSLLPEKSVRFHPVTEPDVACAEWPIYRLRPLELTHPPRRIQVTSLGNKPTALRLENCWRSIVRQEGPERLIEEWWRTNSQQLTYRDYFRIEDAKAERFWIFRDGLSHWYLHGRFA